MKQSSINLQDRDAERNVLGSIMHYRKAIDDVREIITVDCFTTELHCNMYNASIALNDNGDTIDIITVTNELRKRG